MSDTNEQPPLTPETELQSSPPPPARRNWLIITLMALALVGMIVVGLHGRHGSTVRTALTGSVAGRTAPNFELRDINTGQPVKLSDYRGKAVLLNFWATWCPPCKEEIPWFVDLQKQYAQDGLVILGVAMDDAGQRKIAEFSKQMGINYPVLLGTDQVADLYGGVEDLPTTFYIGRDGKIVDRLFGLHSHHEIESNIKAALAQGQNVAEAK
jgi:peroxiredoxin